MQPGIVTLPTSRGLAEVPAWRFTLAQLPWTFTQVAVVPQPLVALSSNPVGSLGRVSAASASGHTLTLSVPAGGCSGFPPPRAIAEIYETPSTVVVGFQLEAQGQLPQACAGVGLSIRAQARLGRPLGSRVVLDVSSGQPVPNTVVH